MFEYNGFLFRDDKLFLQLWYDDPHQRNELPTSEELLAGVYLRLTLLPGDALNDQLDSVAKAFHHSSAGSVLYSR